jgi:hypothetical protein
MEVIGQFGDLGDPDRFVWLRGFADLPSRAAGLSAFYGGPVWRAHGAAANATMLDSDDVLLLRPAGRDTGFLLDASVRNAPAESLVVATIHYLEGRAADFVDYFDAQLLPLLVATGATPLARLVTEPADNNFPALAIRTGENVFVWFASFADRDEHDRHVRRRTQLAPRWPTRTEQLLLAPTPRSILR